MRLKVLSWNIWINGYFDQVKDFLARADADIIGLQEVEADAPERDIIGFLTKLGYEHVFAPVPKTGKRKVNDGPALFSRRGLRNPAKHVLSNELSRCAVSADIDVRGEVLHVFSIHLLHTHQKYPEVQIEQTENLIQLLPKEKTILMGDFNATPDSPVILRMRSVLNDTDLTGTPTWSMYPEGCDVCNPQSVNTRLDYIFTTPDLKVLSSRVEDSNASGLSPIPAEIEV